MEFANKTQFNFDPMPESFSVAATGDDAYVTPVELRESISDLARLSYTRATIKGKVTLDAAGTATVAVRLTDGITDFVDISVNTAGAKVAYFSQTIDVSSISGAAILRIVGDVDVADAARTAQVVAALDIEHPVVISS